jgi:hypothetical protein
MERRNGNGRIKKRGNCDKDVGVRPLLAAHSKKAGLKHREVTATRESY